MSLQSFQMWNFALLFVYFSNF